jgi:hypothetical protein
VLTVPVLCWSIFSRHRPASLAFAVIALTAAAFLGFHRLDSRLFRFLEALYCDRSPLCPD